MAKVVKKIVLDPFPLIKMLGETLHGSDLSFTMSGSGRWASIGDGWEELPDGVKLPNGSNTAWKEYTRELNAQFNIVINWNFLGLSKNEYYKKKEAESNNANPGFNEEDLYLDVGDFTFDPELIEFPTVEIKPPDLSPPEL